MTPSGIDQATFRFVAQCLNHCTTASPNKGKRKDEKEGDEKLGVYEGEETSTKYVIGGKA
jgi:hypothetical protein